MSNIQNYMNYLKKVLGIRSFISDEKQNPLVLRLEGNGPLGFVFNADLSVEESQLFEKIIHGMKIEPKTITRIFSSTEIPLSLLKTQCKAKGMQNLILMTQDENTLYPELAYGKWQQQELGLIKTVSLTAMLKNNKLKRECWQHLKTALQEVSH